MRRERKSMDLTEVTLERKDVFKGRIFSVHVDKVRLPNGETSAREVIEHGGGAAILALDDENKVLVVTQYRYTFGRTLIEIPAGKLDPGEDPAAAALRELKEETGVTPDEFTPLGYILPSPGCYSEKLHLYLARGLHTGEQHLDHNEFLNVTRIPFDELYNRCMSGEIEDAKTVVAVLKVKLLLNL